MIVAKKEKIKSFSLSPLYLFCFFFVGVLTLNSKNKNFRSFVLRASHVCACTTQVLSQILEREKKEKLLQEFFHSLGRKRKWWRKKAHKPTRHNDLQFASFIFLQWSLLIWPWVTPNENSGGDENKENERERKKLEKKIITKQQNPVVEDIQEERSK